MMKYSSLHLSHLLNSRLHLSYLLILKLFRPIRMIQNLVLVTPISELGRMNCAAVGNEQFIKSLLYYFLCLKKGTL